MIQNRFNSRWGHLTSRGNLQYAVTAYYEEEARMLNSIPRNEMLDVCRLKALDFHPQRGFSSKNKTLWDRVIDEPEHRAPSLHIPGTGHVWSSGNFLVIQKRAIVGKEEFSSNSEAKMGTQASKRIRTEDA